MRHSLRLPPAVLLIAACALWGAATVLNKVLLATIQPVTLLVLQLAPSVLVLWTIVLARRSHTYVKPVLFGMFLLGILNPGISYTFSLMGLARISASVTTLLWAAEPLMILGLAAMLLREPVTRRLLGVMLLGGLGVILVTDILGGIGEAGTDVTGVVLLLLAVLCCAVYTVFSRRHGTDIDPLLAVATQQAAGLCWAVALLMAETPYGSVSEIQTIPLDLITAAALSGLLYYAAAYWLYLAALRFVPAAVAGSYFNVIPIFGVAFAMLFLGERLSPTQWVGAAVILVSVFELVRLTNQRSLSP